MFCFTLHEPRPSHTADARLRTLGQFLKQALGYARDAGPANSPVEVAWLATGEATGPNHSLSQEELRVPSGAGALATPRFAFRSRVKTAIHLLSHDDAEYLLAQGPVVADRRMRGVP